MSNLYFINNDELKTYVMDVILDLDPLKQGDLHKNVIDPFSAIFDSMLRGISLEQWFNFELTRQYQKTLQNRIGSFHQKILTHCTGHEDPLEVFDLVNHDSKFVAEIKNKYNTLNAEGMVKTYDKLAKVLDKTNSYYGYKAYYVEIIPRKNERYDTPFTPSDNHTGNPKPKSEKIRRIDGASFYHLVTDDHDALKKLYEILPTILREVRRDLSSIPEEEVYFLKLFQNAFGY